MKQPTIWDVARVAGVSHQTVSRYLRGIEVRPSTRHKVVAALAELDYRPNSAARLLRTQRINRIGVLVHAIDQAGPSRTLAGAAAFAREHDYLLDIVALDGDDPQSIHAALRLADSNQIVGMIATAQTDNVVEALARRSSSVPVATEVTVTPAGFDMTHDEAIGALAADHLLDLGHRDVAYIAGPPNWTAARRRLTGFTARMEARGGIVSFVAHGDWSSATGAAVASEIAEDRTFTAIACANDETAIGVIFGLHRLGVEVPTEMSVVGTDNLPISAVSSPPLTTVSIDFEGEGRRLIEEVLVAAGELDPSRMGEVLPPALISRESSAPPTRAGAGG